MGTGAKLGLQRVVLWSQTAFSPAMFVKRVRRLSAAFASDSSPIMTNGSVVQVPSASVSLRELVKSGLYPNQMNLRGQGVDCVF